MDYRSTPGAVVDRPKADNLPRVITGRAVPFNTPTDLGNVVETIDPAAFRESLAQTAAIPLLTYHDRHADPVGVATDWEHRADGLHGTWQLDNSPRAREVARLIKAGMLRFFSIGFQPRDTKWSVRDDREHVRLMKARLVEVSLVSTPAYAEAGVTGMRTAPGEVADLARRLGVPHLTAAITGTDAEVRSAAAIVRMSVETYGRDAQRALQDFALRTTDPVARTNYARAAAALEDAAPGRLTQVFADRIRADLGPRTSPPPRRRRRTS